MNSEYIIEKHTNRRLLLVFTGWNTDSSLFLDWKTNFPSGWDLLICSDYSFGSTPLKVPSRYDTVYLLAWSLGVAASAHLLNPADITSAFAINGTIFPCHDRFGIPPAIYNGTESTLDMRNLGKFRRRMVNTAADASKLADLLPQSPDIDQLREQLRYIASLPHASSSSLPWQRAYISKGDKIIPPTNQANFWSDTLSTENIVFLNEPHFPNLHQIACSILPDTESVGRHFEKTVKSYDCNAHAQKIIASHLNEMLASRLEESPMYADSVLEIGSGSGLFTHLWSSILKARNATYIDLYPLTPYGVADNETYLQQDAEYYMLSSADKFDCILSASTIQWFADPVGFLRRAADHLNDGGLLLISTFLPGNLGELDGVRPSPVIYHSLQRFKKELERNFKEYVIEEDSIPVYFNSPREALIHLKQTGVSHSPTKITSRSLLENALRLPDGRARLTFRPLYILALK